MDKIKVIKGSLNCFVWGWFSLIPVFGIPAVIIAIIEYKSIKTLAKGEWNAGQNYLYAGYLLALAGLFLNAFVCLFFLKAIVSAVFEKM